MRNAPLKKYSIFDMNRGLFQDDILVEAKTAQEAAENYLKPRKDQSVKRVDGTKQGRIIVTKYIERDGQKFQWGNRITFDVYTIAGFDDL